VCVAVLAVAGVLRPGLSSSPAPIVVQTAHEEPAPAAAPQATISAPGSTPAKTTSSIAVPPSAPRAINTPPAATAPPVATVPSRPLAAISLDVVHLHRFGSCRGRLEATRSGLTFTAHDSQNDESFTLKYTEFLQALADDTLTVKSANKTYRFKAAAPGDKSAVQLRDLADRIARTRG
jgi:hypothetical protein